MSTQTSEYLVETDWLESNLDDANLRVIDCTVFLPNYFDESAGEHVEVEPGREDYEKGQIPGSAYVAPGEDLSDPARPELMFAMPPAAQFAAVMSRLGVGPGTRVVLYDRMVNMWATRVWWMLRAFGFEEAAVLNGGWEKWSAEGRPVSDAGSSYPPAEFMAQWRPELIATKDEVLASIEDESTCLINALDADEFAGRGTVRYGRGGRIPSSVNVSFLEMESNTYLPLDELRSKFSDVGALEGKRVITYCGGGIAASSDAFVLTMLGAEDVALYDGSMTEWAADPELPLVMG